jgi:cell division protein FtsB
MASTGVSGFIGKKLLTKLLIIWIYSNYWWTYFKLIDENLLTIKLLSLLIFSKKIITLPFNNQLNLFEMKKIFLSVLALVFTFAVTSCRDAEKKADENMEEEAEMIMEEAEDMEEEADYILEEAAEDASEETAAELKSMAKE